MSWVTLDKRVNILQAQIARRSPADMDAVARGQAAFQRLGIDLATLTADELERLEMQVSTWPPELDMPAAAIYACLGKG